MRLSLDVNAGCASESCSSLLPLCMSHDSPWKFGPFPMLENAIFNFIDIIAVEKF